MAAVTYPKIWGLALLSAVGCAGGRGGVAARVAPAAPVTGSDRVVNSQTRAGAPAPLEYHEQSDSDRVFIENAERAIGEYTAFINRAGDREEYAQAVKRSREQIDDLREAIIFVRAGSQKP
jgi:hypothetical protein